jgi:DNA-binding LacI/PurR family transcriptional regulator
MKVRVPGQRVSIFAVAKEAGCSIATVSNVLNDKGRVGPKKREEVQRAIQALGYQVSAVGRNLRMRRSEMLGLLFYPTCAKIFKNPFYAEIMEGLEEELTRQRYHLLLAGYQLSVAAQLIPDFAAQGKVDGMILLGGIPASIVRNFCETSPQPLLLLDSHADAPIDSVISDGFSAEISVVNHLASRGHRNILMLAYGMEDSNIDLRIQGFLAGLTQCGLPGGPDKVIRHLLSHDDIYPILRERLRGPSPPTAVAAVNDTLALDMIKRLQADGFDVPGDVSVVGYDDDEKLADQLPLLSTVRVNKKELGRVGAELILKRIANPAAPVVKLRLPVEFIPRDSVASVKVGAI